MKGFNVGQFPLQGRRLIEASAGTGKTYNIANLYLRLLLGDGFDALSIEKILVVTFTRAATEELRGRIREKIEQALLAFRQPQAYRSGDGKKPDDFILALLDKISNAAQSQQACRQLNAALVCMDEASIFTIHGFAVRAIQSFLFETGALAEVELSEAGSERKDVAIADLWRCLQLSDDETLASYCRATGLNSKAGFYDYFRNVPLECKVVPDYSALLAQGSKAAAVNDIDRLLQQKSSAILAEREALARRWQDMFAEADDDAIKAALRPVIDIATEADPKPRTVTQYLLPAIKKWITSRSLWLDVPESSSATGGKIALLLASGKTDALSLLVIDLINHAGNHFDEKAYKKNNLLPLLVQHLQQQLATMDLASMQLDEVIRLINHKLAANNDAAVALRKIITGTYPVCMVDEFQDTDPQQFAMFNSLYGNTPETGFFMIGDPKQSIYAFRGADIFSYLDVRSQVRQQEIASNDQKIFSLDTNFRSKKRLIAATNALFAEPAAVDGKPVFVYDGIDYQQVNSCEQQPFLLNKGQLQVEACGLGDKPLVFIGNPLTDNPDEKINSGSLRYHFASDAAQRISALLQKASIIDSSGNAGNLRAGDIAILVRNGTEARYVRDALLRQTPAIASVYQSQRDSVFSTSKLAQDIYHILCACHEPNDRRLLKTAIITPLYRGFVADFTLLEALDGKTGNDDALENLIVEFTGYRETWKKFGVLAALNLLLQQKQLAQAFARQADCDRLMTDFRHLGDLLQQQYLSCGSPEQLIDWYARQLKDDSAMEEDAKRIRLESDENLVKIVTIHVSKGLEYKVVFLPFFFLPFKVDAGKKLPLLHNADNGYLAEINFEQEQKITEIQLQQEQMAEDMRLLYVAITRAIHQCYIGISASSYYSTMMFPLTPWAHLLPIEGDKARPGWQALQHALKKRLGSDDVAYQVLYDAKTAHADATPDRFVEPCQPLQKPQLPVLKKSPWIITSYSKLANARKELRTEGKDDETPDSEEPEQQLLDDAKSWQDDIRFTLKGSANTGECLHAIYEELAGNATYYLGNHADAWPSLVEKYLGRYGLLKFNKGNEEERLQARRKQVSAVAGWLAATLDTALGTANNVPSLKTLYQGGQVLPEMRFDFSLGHKGEASFRDSINPVLQQAGLAGISLPFRIELQGIMNGAIDLVFIHNNKVYVLDYKSNTLGKVPAFYQQQAMSRCMQESRYDLQYMIYSVAVHRYFRHRFGEQYAYDEGPKLSFGGVFYLFIRGMGITGQPQDGGIWFTRPEGRHITQLDAAFSGAQAARNQGGEQ